MRGAKGGIHLPHFAEETVLARLKSYRHLTHLEVEHNFVGARLLMQIPRSAQRRVAGERQLFIHGKDANLVSLSLFDVGVAREDEGRLGQVGLTGQLLHFAIAEATRVGDDGQLIALQWTIGEDIELNERKGSTSHGCNSLLNYENGQVRLSTPAQHEPCEVVVYNDESLVFALRKRRGSGDSPGLQNRRTASPMSLVRSTRTRFRHLFCAFASHLTSLPSSWLLRRLNVSCIIPQKPSCSRCIRRNRLHICVHGCREVRMRKMV